MNSDENILKFSLIDDFSVRKWCSRYIGGSQ